eukprot:TRINITY_DN991_c0_g1_i7.p1 TRINITY_DN991_c0_g1~~TRINITY_DN991_c0_g1_i7.p1  ORF type:complete len:528 (+),score=217.48 TRINITY_DN991_c0_g1_i7:73-1584(+)
MNKRVPAALALVFIVAKEPSRPPSIHLHRRPHQGPDKEREDEQASSSSACARLHRRKRTFSTSVHLLALVFLVATLSVEAKNPVSNVHLAVTSDPTVMVVSWLTKSAANSTVLYGIKSNTYTASATGNYTSYSDDSGFNHNVILTGLSLGQTYFYKCGDQSQTFSGEYTFTTRKGNGYQGPWSVAFNGDIGTDHSENTIPLLNTLATNGTLDLFVHMGDISYANDHPLFYEDTWNKWFGLMQPALGKVPYMTTVGNHESWCRNPVCALQTLNFTTFKEKFRMPGPESGSNTNMFFSYDYKNVHFISISSESDYPGAPLDPEPKARSFMQSWLSEDEYFQLNWITQDLQKAQANRKNVPWIVITAHRPIYADQDYNSEGQPTGQPALIQAWLEPLLQQYNVDFYITGHVHAYFRTYPVYNATATSNNYENPKSTIHLTSGGGGSREALSHLPDDPPSYMAFGYDEDYGIGYMDVHNNTAVTWKFYQSATGNLIDTFTVTKPPIN